MSYDDWKLATPPEYDNENPHEPDCESLCTDGEDCNCGAEAPKRKPKVARPAVVPPPVRWSDYP